jgi:hypothetical protein
MNTIVFQAMHDELTKIAYMTAAGPQYAGNMPSGMGTGMVSAQQAQQMTRMPGVRSMRRGGIVPEGKTQVAVLHGPEAVVPLSKSSKGRRKHLLKKIKEKTAGLEKKAVNVRFQRPRKLRDIHQEGAMDFLRRKIAKLPSSSKIPGPIPAGRETKLRNLMKSIDVKTHPEYRALERGMYQGADIDPQKLQEFLEELRGLGGLDAYFEAQGNRMLALPKLKIKASRKGESATVLHPMVTGGGPHGPPAEISTFYTPDMMNNAGNVVKFGLNDIRGATREQDRALFTRLQNLMAQAGPKLSRKQDTELAERRMRALVPAMGTGALEAYAKSPKELKKKGPKLSNYVSSLLVQDEFPRELTEEMKKRGIERIARYARDN